MAFTLTALALPIEAQETQLQGSRNCPLPAACAAKIRAKMPLQWSLGRWGFCTEVHLTIAANGLCRDFRAGKMAGLPWRATASIWSPMEIKPRWEPGPGIRVVNAEFRGERWIVKAEASGEAMCPSCRHEAAHLHSRYTRRVQDLPVQGMIVELHLSMTPFSAVRKPQSRIQCSQSQMQ